MAFTGSRADLEQVIGQRLLRGLLLLFLIARGIHLTQAVADVTLGATAYTHPVLAGAVAGCCLAESGLLTVAWWRRGRLTLSGLLVDAAFGVAGLLVLGVATSGVGPLRTGSLNWMLPYTVATTVGFGLLCADAVLPRGPGGIRRVHLLAALATAVLAGTFLGSMLLPNRPAGEQVADVLGDTANYALFAAVGVAVGTMMGRRVALLGERSRQAAEQAGATARQAQWRMVLVDVFGPVVDLLELCAEVDGPPSPELRDEARRLIELIEAVNPGALGAMAMSGLGEVAPA